MHHRVIVPEGRSEYEWFRLLSDVLETGDLALQARESDTPAFGTVVGVIPTHNSAVTETFITLHRLRDGLVPLVDGDAEGCAKIISLCDFDPAPSLILQWRDTWTIEDAIGWILKGDERESLKDLQSRINREFTSIEEFIKLFKVKEGSGRLKADYLAFEDVASVIGIHACGTAWRHFCVHNACMFGTVMRAQ